MATETVLGVPAVRRPRRILRRLGLGVAILLSLLVLALLGLGIWVRGRLVADLPEVRGQRTVAGLAGRVVIERDRLGVPVIRGGSRQDVAFATGFLHAEDRFFQMDLERRRSAGELSELLGPRALPVDRAVRRQRFRAEAERVLAHLPPEQRVLLEAYTRGVNAGLKALGEKPFEYLILRGSPAPWKPEDSLLVLFSMFLLLQDGKGRHESAVGLMKETLPPPLFDFLTPYGTEWDAPMVGEPLAIPPVPGPEVFDARRLPPADLATAQLAFPGDPTLPLDRGASNAWAVAGSRTADGKSLLAVDMHLQLSVPNLWYRASFLWPDERDPAKTRRVTGVTLPGVPLLVVGSNGAVAWGFTISRVDTNDVVLLDIPSGDDDSYLAPGGPRRFEHHSEILRAQGAKDERLDVRWTIWGPEIDPDTAGRRRAFRWVANDDTAADFSLLGLETAGDLATALSIGRQSGLPAQNFVVADSAGHIGWTIAGKIPRREGFDGRTPTSWSDGKHRWNGWLSGGEIPEVVDPPSGQVWSANNRAVGGDFVARLGDGSYVLGARARQIRDDLSALPRATAADMLKIQLDDRALFLARWRDLLLGVLKPVVVSADPRRRELRRQVENWGGRAAVESVGYRAVHDFRERLARRVFAAATLACTKRDPKLDYVEEFDQWEGPLWKLVTERPPNFLDPRAKSWNEELLAVADEVLAEPGKEGLPLSRWTWGRRNTAAIRNAFSGALPVVGRWLDMPAEPLAGDDHMPRVQQPSYGASERLVVSPGAEGQGFFHMPGGESANPISPHYRDAQAAWVKGKPTPFLPGPAVDTLTLIPAPLGSVPAAGSR
jgi:penicillin amidase